MNTTTIRTNSTFWMGSGGASVRSEQRNAVHRPGPCPTLHSRICLRKSRVDGRSGSKIANRRSVGIENRESTVKEGAKYVA
jgi:hypothetical protein